MPLAGGQFNREVYMEGMKRRVAAMERRKGHSLVCTLQWDGGQQNKRFLESFLPNLLYFVLFSSSQHFSLLRHIILLWVEVSLASQSIHSPFMDPQNRCFQLFLVFNLIVRSKAKPALNSQSYVWAIYLLSRVFLVIVKTRY